MAKQLPVTEFDILTLPDYLQLFKALIPFMEYGMQKKLSMLIRANELKHTLSFYNSPYSCNTFKTCSNSSGINANTSLNDILNNIEFSGGNIPLVNVRALNINNKEIDVIIIKNTKKKLQEIRDVL